jgi:hypothetical protein
VRTTLLLCAAAALLAASVAAETFVWIDDEGVTHITNDPEHVPEMARRPGGHSRAALAELWDEVLGEGIEPLPEPVAVTRAEARIQRLVRGAVADLRRGENARASVAFESILRKHPSRPEPHWYLALLDRYRGRYESSQAHLEAFLAAAGDDYEPWRQSAERRLRELADERRLADETIERPGAAFVEVASRHFRVSYDPDLGRASDHYARTVVGYLEDARESVGRRLGSVPEEAMGVVFYGRAAYQREYRQRFSFRTVGFFDGRIHVVSAAHPAEELRALLYHEYVHAVFREQTGGDRPYWLNEGLAELTERESRGERGLNRSERSLLRRRIDAGAWIPLTRLAPSFSGLDDDDARAAYLQATAAADWIERGTEPAQRAHILTRLGQGFREDRVFEEVLGMDTDAIDAAVRAWIRSEFPEPRPAEAAPGL